jgi:hypothetical protein
VREKSCHQDAIMNDSSPKSELEKLRLQRDAKFDEIVSCLARELCLSFASATDRELLVEEAEELTDSWAVAEADNRAPECSGALQILLGEHQDICRQILRLLDSGASDE